MFLLYIFFFRFSLVDPRTMHLSGSPLLRETKSESCSSPSDESGVINNSHSGGFSVIFRPGDTPTSDHDSLPSHRYTTHTTSRLTGVHSRPDEGMRGNLNLAKIEWIWFWIKLISVILQTSTQNLSPNTVMYQHSPSDSNDYHSQQNDNKSQVQQISSEPIQLR